MVTTSSLGEFTEEARRFSQLLSPHPSHATLVSFTGELGAGKTTFIQTLAQSYGIEERITSPTFVFEKTYELAPKTARGFTKLVHIDAYRLKSVQELDGLGFTARMRDSGTLILFEWPEQVSGVLPTPDVAVSITVHTPESRSISYTTTA
jgi:tRNA threonylcarbamoyladenosine biosynthesis protein TsaE